jgi:hypothetical protein
MALGLASVQTACSAWTWTKALGLAEGSAKTAREEDIDSSCGSGSTAEAISNHLDEPESFLGIDSEGDASSSVEEVFLAGLDLQMAAVGQDEHVSGKEWTSSEAGEEEEDEEEEEEESLLPRQLSAVEFHPADLDHCRRRCRQGGNLLRPAPAPRRFLRPQPVHPRRLRAVAEQVKKEGAEDDGSGRPEGGERKPPGGPRRRKEPRLPLFEEMRDSFLRRFGEELHYTFGPEACVSRAPLSKLAEARFLKRWQRCRAASRMDSLRLAFHGTSRNSFHSIFRRGFLLPGTGHGRVPIQHGNAHGAGIYTAREGAAWLSRNFCDSDSMLVCAVIDDVCTSQGEEEMGGDDVMLRIGRLPKRPSACLRVGFGQVPLNTNAQSIALGQRRKLGSYEVLKESSEVRHVGDAMVVFSRSCVTPLFRVDRMTGLYKPQWKIHAGENMDEKAEETASTGISEPRLVDAYWPLGGNPNTSGACPGPPLSEGMATRHEISVQRDVQRRRRQRDRYQGRYEKLRGWQG